MSRFCVRTVVLLFLFLICLIGSASGAMVSISGKIVNVRSGPGKKYPVLWQLGKGFPLKLISRKGNWLQVKDFENDVGWVYRSLTDSTRHLIVNRKSVNIRKGPSTNYPVIGVAQHGVVLKTLDLRGGMKGWAKIEHESGLVGWAKRKLLWGW